MLGAGLLAIATYQPTSMVDVQSLSPAGWLPHL